MKGITELGGHETDMIDPGGLSHASSTDITECLLYTRNSAGAQRQERPIAHSVLEERHV